ncbi:MAG: hypothetical protein ACXAE3_04455 [Candidatus Kariarchaeaceae archaeon]|jgi:hypothetical protein
MTELRLELDEDEWGYRITTDFVQEKVFNNWYLKDGDLLVIKSREYIADIERTVVSTDYKVVVGGEIQATDKRGISDILSQRMFDHMEKSGTMPYDTEFKKASKNIATLEFKPDAYDTFQIKIRKEDVGGDPAEFVGGMKPAGKKPEAKADQPGGQPRGQPRGQRGEIPETVHSFEVAGSKGAIYTVSEHADGSWSCTCSHFMFRLSKSGGHCKHIQQIK